MDDILTEVEKNIKRFVVNEFGTNCYIYKDSDTNESIVIDPGGKEKQIIDFIKTNNLTLKYIILTHCHYDHILALDKIIEDFNVPVIIHMDEYQSIMDDAINLSLYFGSPISNKLTNINWLKVKDMDIVKLGNQNIYILHTPGHTKGSICLYIKDKFLFTGDTLFCGSVGRTDFPTGDIEQIDESLKRIIFLPANIIFFPGHGEPCIVGEEKSHNPFLKIL